MTRQYATSERMQYCGRYLYADNASLERALREARARLASDDVPEAPSTLRFFVEQGVSLTVNLTVRTTHEHRFIAPNLFLVLAHGATYGTFRRLEDKVRLSAELLAPFRRDGRVSFDTTDCGADVTQLAKGSR